MSPAQRFRYNALRPRNVRRPLESRTVQASVIADTGRLLATDARGREYELSRLGAFAIPRGVPIPAAAGRQQQWQVG